MKKKSDALDAELAPIHGSGAFMDFIGKKNGRRPDVCTYSITLAQIRFTNTKFACF